MASRVPTGSQVLQDYGYDDNRFENAISKSFHCSICLNVFKEPKMCRNNQHVFCSSCITRHLANSSRCPECNDELTAETLSQAPRVLLNCLSELKIRCDYFSRGCHEFVQLGNLPFHVSDCGFAPVACNQGCGVEINKRDRIHHETEVCRFREVQCHDCKEMRIEMEKLRGNVGELILNLSEIKKQQTDQKISQTQLQLNIAKVKSDQDELKVNFNELKDQLYSFKDDFIKEVRAMLGNIYKIRNEVPNDYPLVSINAAREQGIVIAGGYTGPGHITKSVEEFSWSNRTWARLQPMKNSRSNSSSFVYENQMIVAGGFDGYTFTAEMVAMKMIQEPLQWIMFPAKLPAQLSVHRIVVYENHLIVVGGYCWVNGQVSKSIYAILLVHPYYTKLLCSMSQPRRNHGTEIINGKIYILGGTSTGEIKDALDSVIVYDFVNNKHQNMPPLPYAVCGMSTVCWQNKVIVLGGLKRNGEILNDVIMYDIVTGESERLPSMKYKRVGLSAVINADCIVVMGGWNKDQGYLNVVECYLFSCNSWHKLPAMNECRSWATAIVM